MRRRIRKGRSEVVWLKGGGEELGGFIWVMSDLNFFFRLEGKRDCYWREVLFLMFWGVRVGVGYFFIAAESVVG